MVTDRPETKDNVIDFLEAKKIKFSLKIMKSLLTRRKKKTNRVNSL